MDMGDSLRNIIKAKISLYDTMFNRELLNFTVQYEKHDKQISTTIAHFNIVLDTVDNFIKDELTNLINGIKIFMVIIGFFLFVLIVWLFMTLL